MPEFISREEAELADRSDRFVKAWFIFMRRFVPVSMHDRSKGKRGKVHFSPGGDIERSITWSIELGTFYRGERRVRKVRVLLTLRELPEHGYIVRGFVGRERLLPVPLILSVSSYYDPYGKPLGEYAFQFSSAPTDDPRRRLY